MANFPTNSWNYTPQMPNIDFNAFDREVSSRRYLFSKTTKRKEINMAITPSQPIELWHGLQKGPILNSFETIINEWNIENTAYQVKLKHYDNYGAPADEALTADKNQQPQLVLAPEYKTSKMMEALKLKQIVPINQILDKVQLSEIAEIVKRTFGDKDGNLASLPLNPSCGVIFTNKNMLKAIGRDPDFVPKSIEELEEVCRELIAQNITEKGYTCAWPAAYLVEVPAAQQNLPLIEPENGKLEYGNYHLSKEWLKQHFLHLRKQQQEGIFVHAGDDNNSRKPFIERKVAFFMQGSTHYSLLQQEAQGKFEIGCGPLPTLVHGQNEKYAFPLGGGSIWVLDNPQTQKMINGVRAFLNHLADKKFQEKWHRETAYVPANATLPPTLTEFYKTNPLHQAVVSQTIEARVGNYSFGLHAPNYADARKAIFELIRNILKASFDEEVDLLLQDFDKKYSLPKPEESQK